MTESSRCVCAGIARVRPAAVAEPVIAAADVEQTVVGIAGLCRRIEFHRAERMGQVLNDVGRAQELTPRALERAGGRVGRAPFGDDVVVGHVLQGVADRNEVRLFRIPRSVLAVHRVPQAVGREFGVKDETDEAAREAFIDRERKRLADIGIDVRLVVRVDPIQQPSQVVREAAAVGQIAHVAHARPGHRRNVQIGRRNSRVSGSRARSLTSTAIPRFTTGSGIGFFVIGSSAAQTVGTARSAMMPSHIRVRTNASYFDGKGIRPSFR